MLSAQWQLFDFTAPQCVEEFEYVDYMVSSYDNLLWDITTAFLFYGSILRENECIVVY